MEEIDLLFLQATQLKIQRRDNQGKWRETGHLKGHWLGRGVGAHGTVKKYEPESLKALSWPLCLLAVDKALNCLQASVFKSFHL